MAAVRKVRWLPSWGLERELDWLRHMGDWMISKKRYWGLALPIWRCDACGWFDVLGSETELRQRAVSGWEEFEGHSPHRPWIDAVKLSCPQCGEVASRVPDVGNVWLDAGIVPYSTLGYRHDRATWAQWFPADFITESFPEPVPELVLRPPDHEHRPGGPGALPHRPGPRPGARRPGPGDAQVLGQRHRVQRGRGAGGGQRDALDVRHRQPGATPQLRLRPGGRGQAAPADPVERVRLLLQLRPPRRLQSPRRHHRHRAGGAPGARPLGPGAAQRPGRRDDPALRRLRPGGRREAPGGVRRRPLQLVPPPGAPALLEE